MTSSVPLWEKRFCTSVCAIPWGKICAAQASLLVHKNIAQWDDSAALEAFQNAKRRYYSHINCIPCSIPLPDPNLYIDEVDHNTIIDPKLIEDLEKEEPPPNNNENNADKGNGEVEVASEKRSNAGWDKYIEKPASIALNKWKCNDAWEELANDVSWNDGRNDPWRQQGSCVDSWGDTGNNRTWRNGDGLNNLWGLNGNNTNVNSRKRNGGYYSSNYSTSRHNNNNGNYSNNSNIVDHQFEKSKARRFYGPGSKQRPSESGAFWYRRNC